MTYPPPPGGGYGQQPDPYSSPPPGQQPGYDPTQAPPVYGQQPDPYGQPVTGVPASPAYGQPTTGAPFSQPPAAPPGERPQKVTLGAMLTLGTGAIVLLGAIIGFVATATAEANLEEFARQAGVSTYSTELGGTASITGIFNILWLVGYTVIAVFLLRGYNGARIAAFIVHGLNIACAAVGMIGLSVAFAALSSVESSLAASGYTGDFTIFPGWYMPMTLIFSSLQIILPIVAIIMLANSQSGQWFKAQGNARAAGMI